MQSRGTSHYFMKSRMTIGDSHTSKESRVKIAMNRVEEKHGRCAYEKNKESTKRDGHKDNKVEEMILEQLQQNK